MVMSTFEEDRIRELEKLKTCLLRSDRLITDLEISDHGNALLITTLEEHRFIIVPEAEDYCDVRLEGPIDGKNSHKLFYALSSPFLENRLAIPISDVLLIKNGFSIIDNDRNEYPFTAKATRLCLCSSCEAVEDPQCYFRLAYVF
jgi:hypothetical protein